MTEARQYLTFSAAGERFALPVGTVQEILQYRSLTPVPGSSPFLAGIFDRGGTITATVDLARKLGRSASVRTTRSCIVVVRVHGAGEDIPVGLMVDAVSDIVDISPAEIQPPPQFGSGLRLEYLLGLVPAGGTFTIVLDGERFLSAAELLELSALDPISANRSPS